MVAGECPYCSSLFYKSNKPYNVIDLRSQCNLCGNINRTGTLCGKCKDNYAPAMNSEYFECVPCSEQTTYYSWILFILNYIPLTFFLMIILFFQISVTSGPANAYVFYAQVIVDIFKLDTDGQLRFISDSTYKYLKRSYKVVYGVWNLHFLQSLDVPWLKFCLAPKMTTMTRISLEYINAIYPLLFLGVLVGLFWIYNSCNIFPSCVRKLCSPLLKCYAKFHKKLDFKSTVLHGFATFIVLSYTKIALVSLILLTSTPLVNSTGRTERMVVYYDGTMKSWGKDHFPYIFASLMALFVFVLIPPIILIAPSAVHYIQTSFKFLRHRDCPTLPLLTQFSDIFHGCYKDGTGELGSGNERDHRYFAGLYLLVRFALSLVYAFTPDWFVQYTAQQLVCTIGFVAFAYFRPYKKDYNNIIDAAIFANLAAINTLTMYKYYLSLLVTNQEISTAVYIFSIRYVLVLIPFLGSCAYIVYNYHSFCKRKLPGRNKYVELTNEDDDFIDQVEAAGRLTAGMKYENSCEFNGTISESGRVNRDGATY